MISRSVAVSRAQHVVDEDRPVEVGVGEAVGLRIKLRHAGCGICRPSGSSSRFQMAADAIGPDQHQRSQRGDGRGADLLVCRRAADG